MVWRRQRRTSQPKPCRGRRLWWLQRPSPHRSKQSLTFTHTWRFSKRNCWGKNYFLFFHFYQKTRKIILSNIFPTKPRQLLLREWEAFETWLHFESAFCPFSFYYSLSYLLNKSTICAFQTRYYSISIQLFTLLRFLIYYLPLLHKTSPKKDH